MSGRPAVPVVPGLPPLPSDPRAACETVFSALSGSPSDELLAGIDNWIPLFLSNANVAPRALLEIMEKSEKDTVRHMAAINLRKHIMSLYWKTFTDAQKIMCKQILIQRLQREPSRRVRVMVVASAVAVCKTELPAGRWPELLRLAQQASQHSVVDVRELSMLIYTALLDMMPKFMVTNLGLLNRTIGKALEDKASLGLRVQAMRAATQLLAYVGDELLATGGVGKTKDQNDCVELLPQVIRVVEDCVDAGQHDTANSALDTLHELAAGESPYVLKLWEPLGQLAMGVLQKPDVDPSLRSMGCELLRELVTQQPGKFFRKGLVGSILENAIKIMGQYELPERPSRDDLLEAIEVFSSQGRAVDDHAVSSAASLVDTIAIHMPSQRVFPMIMKAAEVCLKQPQWQRRATGCILVAQTAEGCQAESRAQIEHILRLVVPMARDKHPAVRASFCYCIGALSQELDKSMASSHRLHVPAMIALTNDPIPPVAERAVFAIDCLMDTNFKQDMLPYCEQLLSLCGRLLQSDKTSPRMEVAGISLISSICTTMQGRMRKFFAPIARALLMRVQRTGADFAEQRATAVDTIGALCYAVGKKMWMPFMSSSNIMHHIRQCFEAKDAQLSQHAYLCLGQIAMTIKDDMGPAIGGLISQMREDINRRDLVAIDFAMVPRVGMGSEVHEIGKGMGAADFEGATVSKFRRSGLLEQMKSSILLVLAQLAQHCPKAIGPHLGHAFEVAKTGFKNMSDDIRVQAPLAMANVMACMAKSGGATPPSGGKGPNMRPDFLKLLKETCMEVIQAIYLELDASVVSSYIDFFEIMASQVGPWVLGPLKARAMQAMEAALAARLGCDAVEFEDEDEEDEGEPLERVRNILIAGQVCDFMETCLEQEPEVSLAAMKDTGLWTEFIKFLSDDDLGEDASSPIGTVAVAAEVCGKGFAPALPDVMPTIVKYCGDSKAHVNVRRNLVFALGWLPLVEEGAGAKMAPQCLKYCVEHCKRTDTMNSTSHAMVDNAVSSVLRVLRTFPSAGPADKLVETAVSQLPLRVDFSEAGEILKSMVMLASKGIGAAKKHLPRALTEAARMISESVVVEHMPRKYKLVALQTIAKFAEQSSFGAVIGQCSPQVQAVVRARLDLVKSLGPHAAIDAALPESAVTPAGSPVKGGAGGGWGASSPGGASAGGSPAVGGGR